MRTFVLLLLLAAAPLPSIYAAGFNPIQLPIAASVDCLSWRLAVETNNLGNWGQVPDSCKDYVKEYVTSGQYAKDCKAVADAAIEYADGLLRGGDICKDVWVFDVDETLLSEFLPNFTYDNSKNWTYERTAIPEIKLLYDHLLKAGFHIVLLSGFPNAYRAERIANLEKVGIKDWSMLILKEEFERRVIPQVTFKSSKRTSLVNEGFKIVGNVGDQWSDLLGPSPGDRSFKVPNPMYYIPL